ncbi:MAG: glycosyltransferase N-terminal domain-containing protein [Weeksellaceae bacterium]|nr:glycosyltransferase N-terminal domain-containing protein [Weeksellaceae bacterium]
MIYSIFSYLYPVGIRLAAPFHPKARLAVRGRENWQESLHERVQPGDEWIWMHCSSLGEFEQGRPVFEALREEYPQCKLALSFFSPSGYEVRKNYPLADLVFYHPFDSKSNAKELIEILQPKMLILVKYDYWHHTLQALEQRKIPIFVISAIFRENQVFFKSWGKPLVEKLKKSITHFFVQDEESEVLLQRIGIEKVSVAGDTRFDRVKSLASQVKTIEKIAEWQHNTTFVLGSTWPEDEKIWHEQIAQGIEKNYQYIIAPHEVNESRITELEKMWPGITQRFSQSVTTEAPIMIVDSIGLLSSIYRYADITYVGGGFKKSGVHNTLEPAVYGKAVICGPNILKFREAKELEKLGVLQTVESPKQLEMAISKLLVENKLEAIKALADKYFREKPWATERILGKIYDFLRF